MTGFVQIIEFHTFDEAEALGREVQGRLDDGRPYNLAVREVWQPSALA